VGDTLHFSETLLIVDALDGDVRVGR
jgi:hypothetical protein